MTAIDTEFQRTNEHGITHRELHRLVDDVCDLLLEEAKEGPIRQATVNVKILKGRKEGTV